MFYWKLLMLINYLSVRHPKIQAQADEWESVRDKKIVGTHF